jgi:hypothetical protein
MKQSSSALRFFAWEAEMKTLFACLVLLVLVVPQNSVADTITVGVRDSGNLGENCIPFGCPSSFGLNAYQQVYSSDAFPGAINIDSVTFFNSVSLPSEPNSSTTADYVFSLSTTAKAVGELDLVDLTSNIGPDSQFFGSSTGGPLTGTQLTVSGDPFLYDPASGNLLLNVSITSAGSDTFLFLDFQQPSPSAPFQRAYNGIPLSERPAGLVTEFGFTPVPVPPTLFLLGTGVTGWALARLRRHRQS